VEVVLADHHHMTVPELVTDMVHLVLPLLVMVEVITMTSTCTVEGAQRQLLAILTDLLPTSVAATNPHTETATAVIATDDHCPH